MIEVINITLDQIKIIIHINNAKINYQNGEGFLRWFIESTIMPDR